MGTFEFDGEKYKSASKHQKEWGNDLISEFSFKGNEAVLDLGCGDGVLTEQLALLVPQGKALGIDASIQMIETAEQICRSNLTFAHMDINKLNFENEFDLIFSNAALHWVKDHKQLLKNAYKALKAHGKILWDFGGLGNCATFIDITVGFSSCTIRYLNQDRHFSNASDIVGWVDQPCLVPFIKYIPQKLKETFRQEVIEEMLKKTRQPDGTYFEIFRRIRICAQKAEALQHYLDTL